MIALILSLEAYAYALARRDKAERAKRLKGKWETLLLVSSVLIMDILLLTN